MKLWQKGYELDQVVEDFMTGDDPLLDKALIIYDCMGSIAHAKMMHKIGILSADECSKLVTELQKIPELAGQGRFEIRFEDEDVHTAVENAVTDVLGDLGKKLHTARSRNDQVLVDIRMYTKEYLLSIMHAAVELAEALFDFAKTYHAIPIPGRTHLQRAMPSSMGLWSGAFLESLLDDLFLLKNAYELNDQCPLGSAASYGVSLPIDRQYTSDLLGFSRVQNNVLYANNSRGKFESIVLQALVQVMNDLSKLSTDIILFCMPEFGYLTLPEKYCPGSSLMPQKRNPCPLELVRAKSATLNGLMVQVLEIVRALPSGYNRDFQETKRPLMQGLEIAQDCLSVCKSIITGIQVNKEICIKSFTPELFATDHVLALAKEGKPFRDAYKDVGNNLDSVPCENPVINILAKKHLGATGNLGLAISDERISIVKQWLLGEGDKWEAVKASLFGI